jgi:hypothetical protein
MNRYARRKDRNHGELVKAFEQLGCSVADLSNAGISGWPDVVLGVAGRNHLCEFKNPESRYGKAGLNPNQQAFTRDWRGGKLFMVSSVDEAAALVRNLRAMAA